MIRSSLTRSPMRRLSPSRRAFLGSWAALREQIMRRDHGRCRHCGEWAAEVHHVVKRSQSTALQFDPDNLVSLCTSCHRWTDEAGAGRRGRLTVKSLGTGRFRFGVQTVDKFTAREGECVDPCHRAGNSS